MCDIKKGEISINNIIIKKNRFTNRSLEKTICIKKEIQNRNNKQFLFFSGIPICELFTNCCLHFSEIGILEKVILCFQMGDERNHCKQLFLDYLNKNQLKKIICLMNHILMNTQ